MSMGMELIGLVPPDDTWQKHKAVWDACKAIGVRVPEETNKFFDGMDPDPKGMQKTVPKRKWQDDMREGFEVDIDSIPKEIKTLRFFCSW